VAADRAECFHLFVCSGPNSSHGYVFYYSDRAIRDSCLRGCHYVKFPLFSRFNASLPSLSLRGFPALLATLYFIHSSLKLNHDHAQFRHPRCHSRLQLTARSTHHLAPPSTPSHPYPRPLPRCLQGPRSHPEPSPCFTLRPRRF
jgi:hypothetical protein